MFTANKRSVMYMTHKASGLPVAVVAIGALLVGSIVWTKSQVGDTVKRGEELGYVSAGGLWLLVVSYFSICLAVDTLRMGGVRWLWCSPGTSSRPSTPVIPLEHAD